MTKSRPAVAGRLFAFPGRCGAAATTNAGDTAPSPKKGTRAPGSPADRVQSDGWQRVMSSSRQGTAPALQEIADTKSEPPAYLTKRGAALFDSFSGTGGESTML